MPSAGKLALALVTALGALVALARLSDAQTPPDPPKQYSVRFKFEMPQMPGFSENVTLVFDGVAGAQRVDYDGGMVTSFFLTNKHGHHEFYQIESKGSSPTHVRTVCSRAGINDKPFMFSAFPSSLAAFNYAGQTLVGGVLANEYVLVQTPSTGAIANYTYYTDAASGAPLLYVYIGFLGSSPDVGFANSPNYDHFVITYGELVTGPAAINASDFVLPSECSLETGAARREGRGVHTPRQLAHRYGLALHGEDGERELAAELAALHKSKFSATAPLRVREVAAAARRVRELNVRSTRAAFALNQFATYTADELAAMRGAQRKLRAADPHAVPYKPATASAAELPSSFSWHSVPNVIGPLVEQGNCGSCWAMASAQTFSSHVVLARIAAGEPAANVSYVAFSPQQLMDCTSDLEALEPNAGCDGGSAGAGYAGIKRLGGWATEADYPYLMQNGVCHAAPVSAYVTGHSLVTPFDTHAMLDALVSRGPVAISVDADAAWTFYSSGVLDDTTCSSLIPDHVVVLVGYGQDAASGADFWQIRNSWSQFWGMDGELLLSRRFNECAVLLDGVIPEVKLG